MFEQLVMLFKEAMGLLRGKGLCPFLNGGGVDRGEERRWGRETVLSM